MKKYTLVLLFLTFVFTSIFSFNINSVSALECASGDLFSSVTGKPCSGAVVPQDVTSLSRQLKIGSKGSDVKIIQQALKDEGYYLGKVDGNYGKRTAKAVREFQDDNDLPLTGIVDTSTLDVLNIPSEGQPTLPVVPIICWPDPCIHPTTSPVISGVSGPQSLNVNQQGTWTVKATDSSGGPLSYGVVWGDEVYRQGVANPTMAPAQQSATFTHSYLQAGNYTPTFTVTNNSGQNAQTSLSVNVGGVSNSSVTLLSPNGGETWTKGTAQTIYWQSDKVAQYDVSLVTYQAPCTSNICPMYIIQPYPIAKNVYSSSSNLQGSFSWHVGTTTQDSRTIPDGAYTMQVCQTGTSVCDSSDSYFKITDSGTIQIPTITLILPAGCTSNTGYSSVSGESCANSRTSANFGDKVYVYGSGFIYPLPYGSNYVVTTYNTINGSNVSMPTAQLSSSLIAFDVPYNVGTGQHSIQVKKHIGNESFEESFSSNKVNLNFSGATTTACPLTATVSSTNFAENNTTWGFDIFVNATNAKGSDAWTTNFQGYVPTFTSYGVIKHYGNFFISSGPLQFTAQDKADSSCSTTITVYPPSSSSNLEITTASPLPNAKVGTSYQSVLGVSGTSQNTNTLYWSIPVGVLPSGMYLSASDLGMMIAGTPTVAGTYTFNLQVSLTHPSTAALTANKQFTLTVDPDVVGVCEYANPPLGYHYINMKPYPICGGELVQD